MRKLCTLKNVTQIVKHTKRGDFTGLTRLYEICWEDKGALDY